MYSSFFGLNDKPFSITPDPRYLFMSERHGEALAHLVYGVTESDGFVQLTGEVGTGKTTLVRTLLQNRLPDDAEVAVILNPQLSPLEFLQTICDELGIDHSVARDSSKALIDALNHHLLLAHAEGRRTILVVDEAQILARDVLEQVRLLTNLETSKQKLLRIILIGQPELREVLARSDLRQLAQRITGRYHLEPLSRDDTARYIEHRLQVAGAVGEIFDAAAKREVYKLSQGVPRVINVICDRALLGAYSRESRNVSRLFVRRAAAEISGRPLAAAWLAWATPAMIAAGIAVVSFGSWTFYAQQQALSASAAATVIEAPARSTAALPQIGPAVPDSPSRVRSGDVPGDTPMPSPEQALPVTPGLDTAAGNDSSPDITLDEQLLLAGDLTDSKSALTTLFRLWGLEHAGTGCGDAVPPGYECLARLGSLNSLKQLDRPAILTLTDSRGFAHSVVLTAIRADSADLALGSVEVQQPLQQVTDLWFGQYLILWKPANGVSVALRPGMQDPSVRWLRSSLAAIDDSYRSQPLDSDTYDDGLMAAVRAFQRDHRLVVDGLAGRQTQIVINSLLAPGDSPRLSMPLLARD